MALDSARHYSSGLYTHDNRLSAKNEGDMSMWDIQLELSRV